MRKLAAIVLFGLLAPAPAVRADIQISGESAYVTTETMSLTFKGGDLIRVINRLNGETYLFPGQGNKPLFNLSPLEPTDVPMHCMGWTRGLTGRTEQIAAMAQFNDLQGSKMNRNAWIKLMIDQETQDLVVTVYGGTKQDGARGLTWGLKGLDLSSGSLIIPAQGGCAADKASTPPKLTLAYPNEWEAQMVAWEGKGGGFVIYTRDDPTFRRLHLSRRGDFMDVGLETEVPAPWKKETDAPTVEWRINTYRGDWRVPAAGYRSLMAFLRRPVEAVGNRAWVRDIRTVVNVTCNSLEPTLLESLGKSLDPKKTLLYIRDWRKAGLDRNLPEYAPSDAASAFVTAAQSAGYRVMLHVDMTAVSPTNPDFRRVKGFQVKDAETCEPVGRRWKGSESDPLRAAYITPAWRSYRRLFIERIRDAVEGMKPDAISLAGADRMWNDGNGVIEGKSYIQGTRDLIRELLAEYPDTVFGADGVNEIVSPLVWFGQRPGRGTLTPHPISTLLFGDHVFLYASASQPNPDRSPTVYLDHFKRYERQGVTPTLTVSSPTDSGPGTSRMLAMASTWQAHGLQPDWVQPWTGLLFRWRGSDGTFGVVESGKGTTRFSLSGLSIYERASGATRLETTSSLPGLPAYDDKGLIGLNPLAEYWLDLNPHDLKALHISALPAGACICYSQVTPRYALFKFAPVERTTSDLCKGLSQAKTGIFAELHDSPIAHGAQVELTEMKSAGDERTAICLTPSVEGKGEVFADYSLTVPSYPHPALLFCIGLADSNGPAVFRITADGKEIWKESVTAPGWTSHRLDLTAYAGQGIRLRLLSTGRCGWTDVRLVEGMKEDAAGVAVAAPDGSSPEFSEAPATTHIPGTLAVFVDKGKPVAAGQNFLDLPFETALESSGIVLPGATEGGGKVGSATCGGKASEKALCACPPDHGRFILTWLIQLPDSPSALNLRAGIADESASAGLGFEVRVNGETTWSYRSKDPHWEAASADLSRWKGKTVLLQLVTDSLGSNDGDQAFWSDLVLTTTK